MAAKVTHTITAVSAEKKESFVEAVKACKAFSLVSFLPTTENCHFERYNFLHKDGKMGIVYDTKADIFTVSAKPSILETVLPLFGIKQKKSQAKESAIPVGSKKKPPRLSTQKGSKALGAGKSQNVPQLSTQKETRAALTGRTNAGLLAAANGTESAQDVGLKPAQTEPAYKDGFAVKNCPAERFESFIKQIKALNGVSVIKTEIPDGISYTISEKTQKCYLRYAPKKKTVQLQGKRSNVFAQVQVILTGASGFNEAVGSHIALTGEQQRTASIQRRLKKILPNAFDLLSEQSKIDLGIGMVDIGNDKVTLTDYSVLLVPPYRGLERFIYDLQQAYGISVKMIGQAYEKDAEGHYMLKLGYRRKTGVVYCEVMSALYTEYFARRNFYAHSDNTDAGVSRFIGEKGTAASIFDNLCKVIDYNARKLKEIGFSVKKQ
ncbi:MAG: hypothetical protein K2M95_04410 [Clostridiales bacterium]|nr:hypothetical protein [Clostridiales bacterium]